MTVTHSRVLARSESIMRKRTVLIGQPIRMAIVKHNTGLTALSLVGRA